MDPNTATILAGCLDGLIGGGLTILGVYVTVKWGSPKATEWSLRVLEETEIRKMKIECLVNLCGYRFAMTNDFNARDEDRSRFMFELNRVPALFAGDEEVQNHARDILTKPTNERLIALLHSMGRTTKLPTSKLSNTDMEKVFLIPRESDQKKVA